MNIRIGYVGLTHLGINSLVAASMRGVDVVGYDSNKDLVNKLNNGKLLINEPNLHENFIAKKDKMLFSSDPLVLEKCDVVYISADVETDDDGSSNLEKTTEIIDSATKFISQNACMIILCQVPPGFTRGINFDKNRLYYQVETLIFGKALDRAYSPERFIVGKSDKQTVLPEKLRSFLSLFHCEILEMSYESAELAKISINCFLVSTVSTTNMLAQLCEELPGAEWNDIRKSLHLDKRIGKHAYLSPGLGLAGGNLERDLKTLLDLSLLFSFNTESIGVWLRSSVYRKNWLIKALRDNNKKDVKKIAVLGLAYKEDTHSTKNSPSLQFLKFLKDKDVKVHDPIVALNPADFPFEQVKSVSECIRGAEVLVIATPWSDYASISVEEVSRVMAGRTIIDPYGVLDRDSFEKQGYNYLALGSNKK